MALIDALLVSCPATVFDIKKSTKEEFVRVRSTLVVETRSTRRPVDPTKVTRVPTLVLALRRALHTVEKRCVQVYKDRLTSNCNGVSRGLVVNLREPRCSAMGFDSPTC
jgi:hypothetical protein